MPFSVAEKVNFFTKMRQKFQALIPSRLSVHSCLIFGKRKFLSV
jgi:hypothetical protein